jgi:hypothetical protein
MARPKILEDGERLAFTLPFDLLEALKARAASEGSPLSLVVVEVLRLGIQGPPSPKDWARQFPNDWDGGDLRLRLIDLRMHQKDLAKVLTQMLDHQVTPGTLSKWITGWSPFPAWSLGPIQRALVDWDPSSNTAFRVGSRSPRV